jgi:hypothetical protein
MQWCIILHKPDRSIFIIPQSGTRAGVEKHISFVRFFYTNYLLHLPHTLCCSHRSGECSYLPLYLEPCAPEGRSLPGIMKLLKCLIFQAILNRESRIMAFQPQHPCCTWSTKNRLSEGATRIHVSNILGKLNALSRTEAAVKAVQLGLISLSQDGG